MVVDVIAVAPRLVALVQNGLEIQRNVGIVLPQGNADRRESLAERQPIKLNIKRQPAAPGTGCVGTILAFGNPLEGKGQHPPPRPQQVDPDQTDLAFSKLLLLRLVELSAWTGLLVQRTQNLDHRDHATTRLEVDGRDEPLPDGLIRHNARNQRFGDRDPVAHTRASTSAPAALDDSNVGNDVPRSSLGGFHKHAFVHTSHEIAWQLLLDCIALIHNHVKMNIYPRLLQVWVHSRERAMHATMLQSDYLYKR